MDITTLMDLNASELKAVKRVAETDIDQYLADIRINDAHINKTHAQIETVRMTMKFIDMLIEAKESIEKKGNSEG